MSSDPSEPSPHDALAHTERDGATTRQSQAHDTGLPPAVGSGEETIAAGVARPAGRRKWPSTGRYVLVRRLGAGGMGEVFHGHDPELDRPVAIKVLHGSVDREARLRMEREARALAKLSHPNVVQIYEIGHDQGRTFIVMELVRGLGLDRWDDEDPGWSEAVRVYLQAGRGLAAAHAEGLVHRDFKPHNCILGDDGRVRVLDFGLARRQEFLSGRNTTVDLDGPEPVSDQLTQTGAFVGTLAYVPLEQLEGRAVDEKCDQFSFCVSLYEAVYGERPFRGRSAAELAHALHREQVRPVPAGRSAPSRLRKILLRGLHRDPRARWPTMDALLVELERLTQPSRRRWVLGLLGAGLLATGAGLWRQAGVEAATRCDGAAAQLAQVWNDDRRARVQAALLGTELPFAAGTWERVEQGLDRYAERWVAMSTQTCEATRVHGQQTEAVLELRMACLAGRRIALRETIEVLRQADDEAVARAVGLVDDLPRLERCEDVEALRAEVAPPEDPETAREVERLRGQLARASALGGVGRFEEALEALAPLEEQAQALGYEPLLAEVEHRKGVLLQERGEHAEAERVLVRSFVRAVEHGHDEVATHDALVLTFVLGSHLQRFDQGRQWGDVALAFARRRHDAWAEASVLTNLGMVLRHVHEEERSLALLREALTTMERVRGPQHPDVAVVLGAIAQHLEDHEDLEGAREHLRRALTIEEQALGPGHPHLATHLGNYGRVRSKQGAVEEGRELLEQALALYQQAGDRPNVAAVLDNLARIAFEQGKLDEAESLVQRSLTELEASLGPTHPSVAMALGNLANLRFEQGRPDEGIELSRRALTIRETALGADHPWVAHDLGNLGQMLREHGRVDEALAVHHRALAIVERVRDPGHIDIAGAAFDLAETLEAAGQREPARVSMERAAAIYAASSESGLDEIRAEVAQWLREHPADGEAPSTP